jgi:hypothetical protein
VPPALITAPAELHTALAHVRSGVDRAAAQVDEVAAGVSPDLAAAKDLHRNFAGVTARMDTMLQAAGDPGALRRAGAAWVDDIAGPVSRLAGVVSPNLMESDDRWTGIAADAYRNTLPAQQAALVAIHACAVEVDVALNDLATAIVKFWVSVAVACLGLVVALAGAVASVATVVGASAGLELAIAGLSALVTAGTAALSSLTDITTDTAANAAALERRLSDSTAFPLGAWPRSTTEIGSDGSITDGDDTDWHARR